MLEFSFLYSVNVSESFPFFLTENRDLDYTYRDFPQFGYLLPLFEIAGEAKFSLLRNTSIFESEMPNFALDFILTFCPQMGTINSYYFVPHPTPVMTVIITPLPCVY